MPSRDSVLFVLFLTKFDTINFFHLFLLSSSSSPPYLSVYEHGNKLFCHSVNTLCHLLCATDKKYQAVSLSAQPIKNSSRVPRYQKPLKVVGFCDFQVASSPCGEALVGRIFLCFFLCVKESKRKMFLCFFLYARESKRIIFLCFFLCVKESKRSTLLSLCAKERRN